MRTCRPSFFHEGLGRISSRCANACSARLAHDKLAGQCDVDRTVWSLQCRQDCFGCYDPCIVHRLFDWGERRRAKGTSRYIVVTDDGEIVRHAEAYFVGGPQKRHGGIVVGAKDSCRPRNGCQQVTSHLDGSVRRRVRCAMGGRHRVRGRGKSARFRVA